MKKSALRILINARDLLSKHFTQSRLEDPYDGWNDEKCEYEGAYCALGAVNKTAEVEQGYYKPRRNGTPVQRAVFFLANAITGKTKKLSTDVVVDVNDDIGKEAMLKAFDRAISNARRRHVSKSPMKFAEAAQ